MRRVLGDHGVFDLLYGEPISTYVVLRYQGCHIVS